MLPFHWEQSLFRKGAGCMIHDAGCMIQDARYLIVLYDVIARACPAIG